MEHHFDDEFEIDFCICLNMLMGMDYEKARVQALIDAKEARL